MSKFCPKCGNENKENSLYCFSCGEKLGELNNSNSSELAGIIDNRYEIKELIKSGGMGAVYLAKDLRLEETCALKEMLLTAISSEEQQYAIERFKQEAKILSKLRHQSLPVVKDYFIHNGRYYLVMDYIEGEDLETILYKDGNPGLKEEQVIYWSSEVLEVLNYLHSQNPPVIYRDMKPANIMLEKSNGTVKLIDFGIARILRKDDISTQTKIGTPYYASPEQFKGRTDTRSDLYSLGAVMHHLLTGMLSTPCKFEPIRSINKNISANMEKFLVKALQDKADHRFQTAMEMKEALLNMGNTKNVAEKTAFIHMKESANILSDRENVESNAGENDYWSKALMRPKKTLFKEMIIIPAGDFWLGEEDNFIKKISCKLFGEKHECPEDVRPRQKNYIPSYYIDKYPVTNQEYKKFIEETGYKSSGEWEKAFTQGKEWHPVINVSWNDAMEYAKWAGKRLPTEEEWEKAARGTDGRIWPWGNEPDIQKLNCKESNMAGTTPVWNFTGGQSIYGVMDMAGNVWEWTASSYMPYRGNTLKSGINYSSQLKVIRGGSWNDTLIYGRCFIRAYQNPHNSFIDIGFRCAKDDEMGDG